MAVLALEANRYTGRAQSYSRVSRLLVATSFG